MAYNKMRFLVASSFSQKKRLCRNDNQLLFIAHCSHLEFGIWELVLFLHPQILKSSHPQVILNLEQQSYLHKAKLTLPMRMQHGWGAIEWIFHSAYAYASHG
jgi:hypothetical protein